MNLKKLVVIRLSAIEDTQPPDKDWFHISEQTKK